MLGIAFRKEMLEQWRSYRLLVVTVVLTLFGLASPLLAKLTPELLKALPQGTDIAALIPPPTVGDAVGQYVKNVSQFGVLLAIVMTMGIVAQEKEKGTAALILVKPMPRWAFLAGKFLALAASFAVALLLSSLAGYYYTLVLFQAPPLAGWLGLNGLMLLWILVYAAITFLGSTLSRSQAVAGGFGFGGIILLAAVGALPGLGRYLPDRLLTWGTGLALGLGQPAWVALVVSLALIALMLAGSWLSFRQQEL